MVLLFVLPLAVLCDATAPKWLTFNVSLSPPRSRLVAAAVGNTVIFAGGLLLNGSASDDVDVLDFSTLPPTHTHATLSTARVFDGGDNMAAVLGKCILWIISLVLFNSQMCSLISTGLYIHRRQDLYRGRS